MNVAVPVRSTWGADGWVIQEVDDRDKVILVTPSKGGTPPIFGGDPGDIHDVVIERMFNVLEDDTPRIYMDRVARYLLDEARRHYTQLGFATSPIVRQEENSFALATRVGTVKTTTLVLALRAMGFDVEPHDGFLTARSKEEAPDLIETLDRIVGGEEVSLFTDQTNLIFEKYHAYLTRDLLELDALSSKVDRDSLKHVAENILASGVPDA